MAEGDDRQTRMTLADQGVDGGDIGDHLARQFIYHMSGLNKAYGAKKVLDNIHLSFYPDAKIGILGPNGAGKSTVLRIMAGLDKEFTGEAWLADGATLGYLPQEPQLDESKT
jgi:ATPase subunit of ABC transporter with duplicated ATPase domains